MPISTRYCITTLLVGPCSSKLYTLAKMSARVKRLLNRPVHQLLPQLRASVKVHLLMLFREGSGIHFQNHTTTNMHRLGQLQS